jgi:hypothetical protein
MSILHKIYHYGCVYDDWVQFSVYSKIDSNNNQYRGESGFRKLHALQLIADNKHYYSGKLSQIILSLDCM